MLNNEGYEKTHFEDHVVREKQARLEPGGVQKLIWAKPDSGNSRIDYLIYNGTLLVTGDLGSAVYRWYDNNLSFAFLGRTDFDYFRSKCEASEEGRDFCEWDDAAVEKWLAEFEAELRETNKDDEEELARVLDCWERVKADLSSASDQQGWEDAINHLDKDDREATVGDDYEYMDVGMTPHLRCWLHWKGIQMAMASIAAENDRVPV